MTIDALTGTKVIDLTRLLPGDLCTMMLGDLGADVIKIEQPGVGDHLRWVPPMHRDSSYHHLLLNRNKRSVTLNLKHDAGKAILRARTKTWVLKW